MKSIRFATLLVLAGLLAGGCTIHTHGSSSTTASGRTNNEPPAKEPVASQGPDAVRVPVARKPAEPAQPPPPAQPATPPPPPRNPVATQPAVTKPVRQVAVRRPVKNDTPFGTTEPTTPASFEGKIYFLPENTQKLPTDFSTLQPVGSVYKDRVDIPERAFEEGFPGITERFEWFAVRYTGKVKLTKAGKYKFRLNSDDGSKLFINGKLVIDNDGTHPPRSKEGKIELDAGEHDFVIEYFQGPRYHIALQAFVTPPGGTETILTVSH